ncbi:hypothetical protein BH10BDE1_BH10BDE1_20060 [soil metagenome]
MSKSRNSLKLCARSFILALVAVISFSHVAVAHSDVPFNVDSIMSDDELAAEFGPAPKRSQVAPLMADQPAARMTAAHASFRDLLSDELLRYYEAILYVNKAAAGATAQTLRIFTRTVPGGDWAETKSLKVSTGREKAEQYFTSTPAGIFNIDGDRVFKMAYSAKWGGSPMPFAMFLDVQFATRKTGIAIHGAPHGSENRLGTRASGGCVRVGNRAVEELYNWITTSLRGRVPQFVFDRSIGKTSPKGVIARDASGQPILKNGYKVLVVIVDERD